MRRGSFILNKYKLIGFSRNPEVSANLMVLSTGKQFNVPLGELIDSDTMDLLNQSEIRQIYKKFYSSSEVETVYDVKLPNEKRLQIYNFLCSLLITLSISSLLTAVKPINFLGITVPYAIFIFPFTYIITDILNEFYGLKPAKRAINITFLFNTIFGIILFLSTIPTPISIWNYNTAYNQVIHLFSSVFLASSVAYILSEHINAWVLYKIRVLTNSRFLFVRVFTSTIIASVIDSFVFISITFYALGFKVIVYMALSQILVKSIYAILGAIPVYWARTLFKKMVQEPS